MPKKLSECLPMQLSCEEGWKMDTVDLANWLKELAQLVEGQQKALVDLLHALKKLTELAENTDQQVVIQSERLDLAAALRWLWDRRYTDGDESGVTPGYTIRLTPAECDRVQAVLIRHQKEVGDAKV